MRSSYGRKSCSVLLAALLGVSGLTNAFVFAVNAEEAETEITTEAESETEVEAAEASQIALMVGEEMFLVTNNSGIEIVSMEFGTPTAVTADEAEAETDTEVETDTETSGADSEAEVAEEAEPESATEDSEAVDCLIMTEADGTEHIFEDVDLTGFTNLEVIEKIGFLFLTGTDADGEEKFFYETADDVVLDEPVTMYTVGMVNIREEPDGESTLLGTADRGSEVEVLGGTSKWFVVTQGEITGYIAARYLTAAEEEATAAVEAEENAQAAAQAAAIAAAQAAAAAASSGSSSDSSSSAGSSSSVTSDEKTEVSREAVYDCDGSGHGYYIVTYSDGSTEYVDF